MRSFLVGFLLLALTSASYAQVQGEVESIGFGNGFYRPECWTPMIVRLHSTIAEPAEYRIEVHQRDLDFDHVVYVKSGITLNAQATQKWEMCFLPESVQNGLPENVQELQERLRVYVTNKEGTRQLAELPITSPVVSLEPTQGNSGFTAEKGQKLILEVTDGSSRPAWSEYQKALGLIEIPVVVPTRPEGLPQSVLAYQAVDAVLWISGKTNSLSEQGSKQLAALQQWVRQGGTLIVCEPPTDGERQNLQAISNMLPILWDADDPVTIHLKDNLEPLLSLAKYRHEDMGGQYWHLRGKFPFARAKPKANAVVDEWITWDDKGKDRTPYIARIPYGLGSVTWVAQDLGNSLITGPKTSGWPYVWDAVFGWKNGTRIFTDHVKADEDDYVAWQPKQPDLGAAQLAGVEFSAKGAGLIVLAIFFFIAYWVVAGPGTYLFLAGRKHKELSWTAFALSALGATLLTVLVVRVVLRGSPEVHHATDIRMVSGQDAQPAIAYSHIGLYIPRDGDQRIALADASGELLSYIAPMSTAPRDEANDFPATLDYTVPVRDQPSADPPSIDVPFRSTLKKLQAKWCGDITGGIRANSVKLNPDGGQRDPIRGSLDNLTGVDLKNIYIAFRSTSFDFVLYIPSWPAAAGKNRLNLDTEFPNANPLPLDGYVPDRTQEFSPEDQKPCRGNIGQQWGPYWDKRITSQDSASVPTWFPVLSLFNRVPPARNTKDPKIDACTLLRRGARNQDMSQALAAGELVVLGQADARPLPYPLEVNGSKVAGEGTVYYQFALPMDQNGAYAPDRARPQ
jgi:hypothetical protein